MERVHLVTGATGFLGSALVLELLRRTPDQVLCIARPAGDARRAEARVRDALTRAAEASLQRDVLEAASHRWRALPGDLLEPHCGIRPEQASGASRFWHVAASLRFEPRLEREILQHNVDGTRQALALASELGLERFNYVSTAYVAGARRGRILEELPDADIPVNNGYERSKILAEREVAASGLDYRIFRPSIVIGHSKTASPAGSDSGFYGYIRRLVSLRRLAEREGAIDAVDALWLTGDPEAPLDLIPVDAVVENAVAIDARAFPQRIFHLTNAEPPLVGEAAEVIGRRLGMSGPHFYEGPPSGPYARQIAPYMDFFLSYVCGGKEFDRSHTDAAIGAQASLWPLRADGLDRYVGGYLQALENRA